ncbi:MAG: GNAT family N-acetyltransferase [Deltaproteobacteria bacterium]|nr:GNAT family N-acetyltransferase [Deltaproteobacteria bacterium]
MKREQALGLIKRGQRVFLGTGCGEPVYLVEGLMERADELQDVQILHFLTLSKATTPEKRFDRRFRHNAFFVGPVTGEAINQARADYTPVFKSEIPKYFKQGTIPLDVALIQVSPPDRWGYVSLGISVDIVKSALESAKLTIAQINPRMPRTMGETYVHISKIDWLVEHEAELLEFTYPQADQTGRRIAANAAKLVRDGDTIHIGFGHIPYTALDYLNKRQDLGVHTEVISDKIIDLIEAGVITGERKTINQGKIVTSFCFGTRRIYDYVDQNPVFMFMPSEYVYSPRIICQNDRMVSIGTALEVDLSGQVCTESLGRHFYSGLGGRLDFMRGAAMSEGGRSIICLPSTTKDGTESHIVAHLPEGAGVVGTRGDIDNVATEFGVVSLRARSVRERAIALISIAHPRFRKELLEQAKAKGYVYPDQIIIATDHDLYPHWVETEVRLDSGLEVLIRPIKPTDESLIQDFFYSHTEETIYNRYFRSLRALPHDTAQNMVNLDYRRQMAIVATTGRIGREKIVGVARFSAEKDGRRAEVAYTVDEKIQGRGLGTVLQYHLARYARAVGFKGLTALVLETNKVVMALFSKLGPYNKERVDAGIYKLSLDFDQFSPEAEKATRPPANNGVHHEQR